MPLIVLGIIPTVFAMIYGSMFFLMIGLVMIAAGAGDLMMAIRLLKYKSSGGDIIIYDHLFMAGAIVFEKVNN